MVDRVVIVGGSVGGVRVAQALRSENFRGEIVMVSDEPGIPYDRPPLSKALICGECDIEDVNLLSQDQVRSLGLALVSETAATGIDIAQQRLELTRGAEIAYDRLVIATGSKAIVPPWAEADGVHTLRTLPDTLDLQTVLRESRSLAIIGAGFIGCEVAAAARKFGSAVHIIDPLDRPMARVLDDVTGAWFARLHTEHGVSLKFGHGVTALRQIEGQMHVTVADGSSLTADAVVLGVGARPNTSWLQESGLVLEDGVRCDEFGRCLGADHVFAVGDVSSWDDSSGGPARRHEHWTRAVNQATCVAHNIVCPEDMRSDDSTPYVWSDQYDWKAHIVGDTLADRRTLIGDPHQDGKVAALYSNDEGLLVGAVVINWPRASITCRRSVGAHVLTTDIADKLRPQLVKATA